ncbi:hypothetical protein AAIB48_09980 [Paraclostridium benzoelyticum]
MNREELAIINFKKAKEYENNKLEARRSEFFKMFKEFADILN